MPKIDAPTVAEHHSRRREGIIAAAVDVLRSDGVAALTPAVVAARTGLARSSVYQYYESTGALVGVAVQQMFQEAVDQQQRALEGVIEPADRLVAYLDVSVQAAVDGHLPLGAYRGVEMPDYCRDNIIELHDALIRPLVAAVRDAGVADADAVAALINGAVSAAAAQIRRGADPATIGRVLHQFVGAGLGITPQSSASH